MDKLVDDKAGQRRHGEKHNTVCHPIDWRGFVVGDIEQVKRTDQDTDPQDLHDSCRFHECHNQDEDDQETTFYSKQDT